MRYRYGATYYHIAVRRIAADGERERDATTVSVDGVAQDGNYVRLADDRREHRVEVSVALRCSATQMSIA
jgi:hypothetical protein